MDQMIKPFEALMIRAAVILLAVLLVSSPCARPAQCHAVIGRARAEVNECANLERTLLHEAHVVLDLSHANIQTLSEAVDIYRRVNAAWRDMSDDQRVKFAGAVDRMSVSIDGPEPRLDSLFSNLLRETFARVMRRQREGWPGVLDHPGHLGCDTATKRASGECAMLAIPSGEYSSRW